MTSTDATPRPFATGCGSDRHPRSTGRGDNTPRENELGSCMPPWQTEFGVKKIARNGPFVNNRNLI